MTKKAYNLASSRNEIMITQNERLNVLLADYSATRDDARQHFAVQATLATVVLASISLIVLVMSQDSASDNDGSSRVPEIVLAGLPLLPSVLMSYITILGTTASLRSFYLRALEREIRSELSHNYSSASTPTRSAQRRVDPSSMACYAKLAIVSSCEVETTYTTQSHGVRAPRILLSIMLIVFFVALVGIVTLIAIRVSWPWRLTMIAIYGLFAGVNLRAVYSGNVGARQLFERAVADAAVRIDSRLGPDQTPSKNVALLRYLIIPRPRDWIKLAFFPIGFGLAAFGDFGLLTDLAGEDLLRVTILYFALEFLVYYARYQWNDILGLYEDASHPLANARMRIPIDTNSAKSEKRGAVVAVIATALLRLYAVVIIGSIGTLALGNALAVLVLLVFGVSLAYEYLRRWGSGRFHSPRLAVVRYWAIYLLVGVGYAIRIGAGYWAAHYRPNASTSSVSSVLADLMNGPFPAIVGFSTFLGSTFVVLTWTLEATSFICGDPSSPGGRHYLSDLGIDSRSHILYLAEANRFLILDDNSTVVNECPEEVTRGDKSRPLRSGDRSVTPAVVFSGAAGVMAGLAGVSYSGLEVGGWSLMVAALCAICSLCLNIVSHSIRPVVLSASVGFVLILGWWSHEPAWHQLASLVLPIIALGIVILAFRSSSYFDIYHAMDGVVLKLRASLKRAALVLLGSSAHLFAPTEAD